MACLHKQTNNFKFLTKDYNERRLITKKRKKKKMMFKIQIHHAPLALLLI